MLNIFTEIGPFGPLLLTYEGLMGNVSIHFRLKMLQWDLDGKYRSKFEMSKIFSWNLKLMKNFTTVFHGVWGKKVNDIQNSHREDGCLEGGWELWTFEMFWESEFVVGGTLQSTTFDILMGKDRNVASCLWTFQMLARRLEENSRDSSFCIVRAKTMELSFPPASLSSSPMRRGAKENDALLWIVSGENDLSCHPHARST